VHPTKLIYSAGHLSINAESKNIAAAWEFVKYMNSDTMANITSRAPILGGLPVRTEYIKNDDGKHLEAFYSLAPREGELYAEYATLPRAFSLSFGQIAEKHWDALLNDDITVEQALQLIETEAQAALDAAYEAEKASVQ
jgi:multiple sugar transport system substrate-binding protein